MVEDSVNNPNPIPFRGNCTRTVRAHPVSWVVQIFGEFNVGHTPSSTPLPPVPKSKESLNGAQPLVL